MEQMYQNVCNGKHGKSGPLEGSTILRRTICEGNMEKVGHLRVASTILRRTICEGNMEKVGHLRVRRNCERLKSVISHVNVIAVT